MPQPDERESLPEITPEARKGKRIYPGGNFSLRTLLILTGLVAIILSVLLTIDRRGFVRIVENPKYDRDVAEKYRVGNFPSSFAEPEFKLEVIRPVKVKGRQRIGFTLDPISTRINVHLQSGIDETALYVLIRTKPLGTVFLSSTKPIPVSQFRKLSSLRMTGLVFDFPVTDEHVSVLAGHAQVESISIWRSQITDKSVDTLCTLPNLKRLDISSAEITDAGLERIALLKNLTSLSLGGCSKITDNGIQLLAQLQQLERLFLFTNASLTGRCIKPLCTMTKLRRLELGGMKIEAGDCANLTKLCQLITLGIYNTRVNDAGVEYISQMTSLRSLTMNDAGITDDGVAKLNRLAGLLCLDLSSNRLTDTSAEHLMPLKRLETLDLSSTEVTEKGLKELNGLTRLKSLNRKNALLGKN